MILCKYEYSKEDLKACGRHYDESNKNDIFSPSWFKSKGEGHFKRDCPNSSGVRFLENCSEEGNSSSINSSQAETHRVYATKVKE
ncbi:unnamed protein product [Arabidopsis thaliana]|uniref:Uncharacterized protein n=1 Tax=Arabidopsis thaliana TaxID=3702 RepID=A0A5S9XI98_ARATH|nr:unnamed protein product [Arabidopsis thaliana]